MKSHKSGRGAEIKMVPEAKFTSYYGRPVVKPSPWGKDIPAYLFLGGLAAGSSLLGVGADLTKRNALRRNARLSALGAIGLSYAALVHDLGRPSRFVNMLRVAKPTSPMSVGTWIITLYGPAAGLAGAYELRGLVPSRRLSRLLDFAGRPAGLVAALLAPMLASYTAVLLGDTATPSWHEGYKQLPFIFVGSAASASGGMGIATSPPSQAGPARRLAVGGALLELLAMKHMEDSMGIVAEPFKTGNPGRIMKISKLLTVSGALGTILLAKRSRFCSVASGIALLSGSACTRFGIFQAGQNSALDPKYTIVPQRERLAAKKVPDKD